MVVGKSREDLQELFKTGAKPSGADFQLLIDSALNSSDDGIEKPLGADTPLKILARGDTENVLDFYSGDTHTWRVNQKPAGTSNSGLSFESGDASKLFIDSGSGNVGLSVTAPTAKLHIKQSGTQTALRIEDEQGKSPLIVSPQGTAIDGALSVTGSLSVSGAAIINGLTVTGSHTASDGAIQYKGTLAIKSGAPQIDFMDTDPDNIDWSIRVNGSSLYFVREPWQNTTLVINESGNVGIGTPAPSSKLEVSGVVRAEGLVVSGRTGESGGLTHSGNITLTGAAPQIDFVDSDHSDWCIHVNNDMMHFLREPFQDRGLTLKSDGKVGVGTIEPTTTLEVQGTFMEKMDIVDCRSAGTDWYNNASHPLAMYFKGKLAGKPVGTLMRALTNGAGSRPAEWRYYFWFGWVDMDGNIRMAAIGRAAGYIAV